MWRKDQDITFKEQSQMVPEEASGGSGKITPFINAVSFEGFAGPLLFSTEVK